MSCGKREERRDKGEAGVVKENLLMLKANSTTGRGRELGDKGGNAG